MGNTLEKLSRSPSAIFASSTQSSKMAIVAALASISTAAMLLGYQGAQRKQRVRRLKDMTPPPADIRHASLDDSDIIAKNSLIGSVGSDTASTGTQQQSLQEDENPFPFDEELIQEQLARNIAFLGEDGVQKLRRSFVIIVGAGGVGSWAASMLIKSGVGKVRIIDYGQVELSGLNQHATASRAETGIPKAVAMKNAFRKIAPWAKVEARVERLQEDSAETLLSGKS
jgi:hypothetical protein